MPPAKSTPLGETSVERARRNETYEHLRARLEAWILEDELTHAEAAERLSYSANTIRFICDVLGIHAGVRRNRFATRDAAHRRVAHASEFFIAMQSDRALARSIREYQENLGIVIS